MVSAASWLCLDHLFSVTHRLTQTHTTSWLIESFYYVLPADLYINELSRTFFALKLLWGTGKETPPGGGSSSVMLLQSLQSFLTSLDHLIPSLGRGTKASLFRITRPLHACFRPPWAWASALVFYLHNHFVKLPYTGSLPLALRHISKVSGCFPGQDYDPIPDLFP